MQSPGGVAPELRHTGVPCAATMLGTPAAPTLETPRLILRGWRPEDFEPYAAMLADPETARFITRKSEPMSKREASSEMALLIGHWQMLGHGMNLASQRVAERGGERRTDERFTPFREPCDIWELRREDWLARGER